MIQRQIEQRHPRAGALDLNEAAVNGWKNAGFSRETTASSLLESYDMAVLRRSKPLDAFQQHSTLP